MTRFDVAIVGGGPAGSTVASLLRKYAPELSVLVLERERFPRDHVGESQLPLIGAILDEMGVWEKVEAAGFPIKVGATYKWGRTDDLWHFNFVPNGEIEERSRPATYNGDRRATAFQVDRAIYDEILLSHAEELGATVRQSTKVRTVERDGDRVTGLILENGERIEANRYVDATGGAGLLRRAMGVEVDAPTTLRNVAIWDYWQNADWAEEIGIGGTRVQVMSLGYGWVWFIPLGPTRTSVGLIVPASYYKESGLRPKELYAKALAEEPRIRSLMTNATSEGKLASTNDWSYVSGRMAGENWFLAGDSCGFADPILAAGMTLAHAAAREVAYILAAEHRGEHDPAWMRAAYDETHRRRIGQHIRFADYWYTANSVFTDLVENTSAIAADAGLSLDPQKAFQWLGTGGFANDDLGGPSVGAYTLGAVKQIAQRFAGERATWRIGESNEFRMVMDGVRIEERPRYEDGRIERIRALVRRGHTLPLEGPFGLVHTALAHGKRDTEILSFIRARVPGRSEYERDLAIESCIHALEAMVVEGWAKGTFDKKRPILFSRLETPDDTPAVKTAA